MAETTRIYNYDSATDGWKTFPGAEIKKVKVDMKNRGIREVEIAFTHYCKAGKTLCGLPEDKGATFRNSVKNQCDGCREGLRKQTKEAYALRDAGDESKNVVDYKAAAVLDKPESSKVSH